MKTFAPGSTIGILGGGQLGRMTALAAAQLGYRCHVFCPDENEPAIAVAAAHTKGAFDDRAALEKFAASVDVITLEWENVPLAALEVLAAHKSVLPGTHVLRVAQDRGLEKNFAREQGIGTADFTILHSAKELAVTLKKLTGPAILKSTRMGYDGKGQVRVEPNSDAAQAWRAMGSDVGILESFVTFTCEISVIVARRADGVMVAYPPVENRHRDGILDETHAPATIDAGVAKEAVQLARKLAEKLDVVGLLAVEMFVLATPNAAGQRVLMNEVAPRPHNSGHWTMDACAVDQFEQLVRAVCGLPLGDTTPHSKAIMRNLIGKDVDAWPQILHEAQSALHLYGKTEARTGRKMGHVTRLQGPWTH